MSDKTTTVVGNDGAMHETEVLTVDVKQISNFVEANRKAYFEDHSLAWCLDEIVTRGIAEIKRTIKTAEKRERDAAAGALIKGYNLTPEMAAQVLKAALEAKRIAEQKAAAK